MFETSVARRYFTILPMIIMFVIIPLLTRFVNWNIKAIVLKRERNTALTFSHHKIITRLKRFGIRAIARLGLITIGMMGLGKYHDVRTFA